LATDRRPHQPPPLVVEVHNQLAYDQTVPEGHHPGAFFQANVGDESGCEPLMECAHISKRVPDGLLGGESDGVP
jgi:hypothetical protein